MTNVKSDLNKVIEKRAKKLADHMLNPAEFEKLKHELKTEINGFILNKALNKYRLNRKAVVDLLSYTDGVINRNLKRVDKSFVKKKK